MKKHDAATKIVSAIVPRDLSTGSAAKQGDWVELSKYDSVTVVYTSDAGTAGEDPTVKLRQATSAAGANAKDLDAGQWYVAQHASALTDSFAEDGTAGEFEDDGETQCIARIEVTADQLDVNNDFRYVQVHVSDSGATAGKLGAAVYILRGARWSIRVDEQPTVLD